MKALVTGGAGFIGSALVERLLAEDHEVEVVDDLSTGSLANLAGARRMAQGRMSFNQLDLASSGLVDLLRRSRPQVLYHLASTGGPVTSVRDPISDAESNLLTALRVLEAARTSEVQRIVFASSDAVYGDVDPSDLPIKESHPLRPVSPHGVAKKAFVDYLSAYRELHSLEFTALVLGHVYGPGQISDRGVVATFAARLLGGQTATVFGDGSQSRDFVYVDDAVDAFARAATRGGGLVLNVATGVETRIGELYQMVAREAGVDHPAALAPPQAGQVYRSCLDPSRAGIHLGWKPWTSLEEGVAHVVESVRS